MSKGNSFIGTNNKPLSPIIDKSVRRAIEKCPYPILKEYLLKFGVTCLAEMTPAQSAEYRADRRHPSS